MLRHKVTHGDGLIVVRENRDLIARVLAAKAERRFHAQMKRLSEVVSSFRIGGNNG